MCMYIYLYTIFTHNLYIHLTLYGTVRLGKVKPMLKFSGLRCTKSASTRRCRRIFWNYVKTTLCCDDGNLAEVDPAQVFQKMGL